MTDSLRDRLFAIWRRVLSLSWPVMAEQVLRTMMRTTDIIVTGLFSPASVAAIGFADLYARLPLRIGLGLGGAIALSSQDTGSDATANRARFKGWTTGALAVLTVGTVGVALFFGADWFVGFFTDDAANFGRVYGLSAPFPALFVVLSGSLQGGSDTRTPFVVRTTGMFGFLVGFSWLVGVHLGYGVPGVYAGIFCYYARSLAVVGVGFRWGGWAGRAARMMEGRGSVEEA